MYCSVLVPLDGSTFSEHTLPLAANIARRCNATLNLVHVHVPVVAVTVDEVPMENVDADDARRAAGRAYIEGLEQRLSTGTGVKVRARLLEGPVDDALCEAIAETGADIVIMTTHGHGGITRLWLGSVADALIHRITVPMLLVRPHDTATPLDIQHGFHRILIPLDGSHLAEQILAPVLALGRPTDAEYTLVQVVNPLVVLGYSGLVTEPHLDYEATRQRQDEAEHYLGRISERLRGEGLRVRTRVLLNERPAPAVLHAARDANADLIALATHGRGGLARLMVGSTADKVLRAADCPVLLNRPRESSSA